MGLVHAGGHQGEMPLGTYVQLSELNPHTDLQHTWDEVKQSKPSSPSQVLTLSQRSVFPWKSRPQKQKKESNISEEGTALNSSTICNVSAF